METETFSPSEVPVGILDLARNEVYSPVTFCDTCKKKGTPQCYLRGEECHPSANFAYVSGAYPWNCIFCRMGHDGKPVENYMNLHTYDSCPFLECDTVDEDEKASAEKWGCTKIALDGKSGDFCEAAVRRIMLRPSSFAWVAACSHYEWEENADHAHALRDKRGLTYHPMSFKSLRAYAEWCKSETLFDFLFAFDVNEYRAFCVKHKFSMSKIGINMLEMYAQAYGWFWIGDREAFRKGTPAEQSVRVAKTIAAVANAKARGEAQAKEAKKKKKQS